MTIIDAHVHLYPPEINRDPLGWATAQAEPHWATLSTRRRRDGRPVQSFPSVDELLRAMDAAGVARAILQGWYWSRPETCALQNRFYAACIRTHPDRLAAFAAFHAGLKCEAALAKVRQAHDEGFLGLGELSPHSQGYAVDDAVFRAALALAAELGLPIDLHVTDPNGRDYPGRVETPLEDFERLALECPRNIFILAHWGGLLPLRRATAVALDNLYYDTAASPLLYDSTVWQQFAAAAGADRILFGSDFPLNLYPKTGAEADMVRLVNEVRGAALTARQQTEIFQTNITRVLRWPR